MISGFLILDKPIGITSAHAVAKVKWLLRPKKIGHGGTLDPLASGVLPLALNNATKLFDKVAATRKTYRFTITWGESRDTDDAEGKVTGTTEVIPSAQEIDAMLPQFIGTVMQTPPIYSAIKVDGKRAYALARSGVDVKLQPRPVEIYSLKRIDCHAELVSASIHQHVGQDSLPDGSRNKFGMTSFEMECGKGTYVRSVARDLASKLNSLGYISVLRRTHVGPFHENDAISLEKLGDLVHNGGPVETWLDGILARLNLT